MRLNTGRRFNCPIAQPSPEKNKENERLGFFFSAGLLGKSEKEFLSASSVMIHVSLIRFQ